jgi:hypothetical protein
MSVAKLKNKNSKILRLFCPFRFTRGIPLAIGEPCRNGRDLADFFLSPFFDSFCQLDLGGVLKTKKFDREVDPSTL